VPIFSLRTYWRFIQIPSCPKLHGYIRIHVPPMQLDQIWTS
jgi:hypothetical protein